MNTEKKLVTTNIPKELPEIKVSSIDAKGFWETFEKTYAEKPDEITVLDKYVLSAYPASEKNSVFVATDGDDGAGDGSIVKPFASIKRALQEVEGKDGAAIQVRGGSYKIDETICLTDKNSGQDGAPLFITAYGDEKVTMTTGISLSGDKFVRADKASFLTQKDIDRLNKFTPNNAERVYAIDLRAEGLNPTELAEYKRGGASPLLFVDGDTYMVARHPNMDEENEEKSIKKGKYPTTQSQDDIKAVGRVTIENSPLYKTNKDLDFGWKLYIDNAPYLEHVKGYDIYDEKSNPLGGKLWMFGACFAEWFICQYQLTLENDNGRPLLCASPEHSIGIAHGDNHFYFFDMIEDLDADNEYVLDAERMLLFIYAPNGLDGKTVTMASAKHNFFDIQGTKNFVISGLSFKESIGSPIKMKDAEQFVIQSIDVSGVRGHAIEAMECREGAIIYNKFYNCGRVGLDSVTHKRQLKPTAVLVQNNDFRTWIKGGIGSACPFYMDAVGDVFSHNYILCGTIGLQGYEHVIEYNVFERGSQMQIDNGPIYGGSKGTHIRNNLFKNLDYSLYGIYMDDTTSGNYIYNNVIHYVENLHVAAKCINLHNDSMMVVMNNVCINGTQAGIMNNLNYYAQSIDGVAMGGGIGWNGASFATLVRNVYTSYYAKLDPAAVKRRMPFYDWHMQHTFRALEVMNNDPDWDPVHSRSKEDASELIMRTPKFNTYKNNISYRCNECLLTTDVDLDMSIEANNIKYDEDPGFVDYANGDFNLRADSRVFRDNKDFVAVDLSRVGILD